MSVLVAPLVGFALLTTACSGGDLGAASQTTVQVRPTNYVTMPVVTAAPTNPTVPGEAPREGANVGSDHMYEVQSGDTLVGIARRYGITLDELVAHNQWSDGNRHFIYQGLEIKIPPFAEIPSDGREGRGDPLDELEAPPDPTTGPLCPDGTERETYTVKSSDYQGKVANALDVPLELLAAVNSGNSNWNSFIPGHDLWLPCEGEDLEEVTETTTGV